MVERILVFVMGACVAILFMGIATIAQSDPLVVTFTPYEISLVYADPSINAPAVGVIDAGVPVALYTPYVGGDARWWAATSEARDAWVPIAVNGYCPRQRLGDVVPEMPK